MSLVTHSPLHDMLLIEEPTIIAVKDAMTKIANWFVLPSFVIALAWEYFNEFKFIEVVKKLILVLVFIGAFYSIHKQGVELSLKSSGEILKEISPNNLFLKKWTEIKVRTSEDKMSKTTGWGAIERLVVPNFNDLIGTIFFLLSKLLIWILKLIYSTVYHLTYIFAPLTAVLYFFPITNGSIKGTIVSSLWCMILPFVLVAILAIVGNSFQNLSSNSELVISSMDQILWLFGVTLLICATPLFTLGLLKGGGMAMAGTATTVLMSSAATKIFNALPIAYNQVRQAGRFGKNILSPKSPPSKEQVSPRMREMSVMTPVGDYSNQISTGPSKGFSLQKQRGDNKSNSINQSSTNNKQSEVVKPNSNNPYTQQSNKLTRNQTGTNPVQNQAMDPIKKAPLNNQSLRPQSSLMPTSRHQVSKPSYQQGQKQFNESFKNKQGGKLYMRPLKHPYRNSNYQKDYSKNNYSKSPRKSNVEMNMRGNP